MTKYILVFTNNYEIDFKVVKFDGNSADCAKKLVSNAVENLVESSGYTQEELETRCVDSYDLNLCENLKDLSSFLEELKKIKRKNKSHINLDTLVETGEFTTSKGEDWHTCDLYTVPLAVKKAKGEELYVYVPGAIFPYKYITEQEIDHCVLNQYTSIN